MVKLRAGDFRVAVLKVTALEKSRQEKPVILSLVHCCLLKYLGTKRYDMEVLKHQEIQNMYQKRVENNLRDVICL